MTFDLQGAQNVLHDLNPAMSCCLIRMIRNSAEYTQLRKYYLATFSQSRDQLPRDDLELCLHPQVSRVHQENHHINHHPLVKTFSPLSSWLGIQNHQKSWSFRWGNQDFWCKSWLQTTARPNHGLKNLARYSSRPRLQQEYSCRASITWYIQHYHGPFLWFPDCWVFLSHKIRRYCLAGLWH